MGKFRPDLRLPAGLETLVMKCLEKKPEDRIPSMDAVLRLLRTCAESTAAGMVLVDAYIPENDEDLPDTVPHERSLPERTGESFDALKYDISSDFLEADETAPGHPPETFENTKKLDAGEVSSLLKQAAVQSQEMPIRVPQSADLSNEIALPSADGERAERRPAPLEHHTHITPKNNTKAMVIAIVLVGVVILMTLGAIAVTL
jgi:hypothetical protein